MATETRMIAATRMELWHELMEFYIREAWLLDERRFREWLDLFTEDVFYFMPRRLNIHRHETDRELTPIGDLAIFEDDKTYLTMRVERLETAWPGARTAVAHAAHRGQLGGGPTGRRRGQGEDGVPPLPFPPRDRGKPVLRLP